MSSNISCYVISQLFPSLTSSSPIVYPSCQREVHNGSVLHEVPKENRDQEPEEDHHEEQETSDSGCVFQVWNKSV